MDIEMKDKASQRYVGHNLQKIRVYLGMRQEALTADLGISQQEISKIEKQDEIEDRPLTQMVIALGMSAEVIRDSDVERVIHSINSYKDATISPGATAAVCTHTQQINPLDKITELYECLLQNEGGKIGLLENANK